MLQKWRNQVFPTKYEANYELYSKLTLSPPKIFTIVPRADRLTALAALGVYILQQAQIAQHRPKTFLQLVITLN